MHALLEEKTVESNCIYIEKMVNSKNTVEVASQCPKM